MRSYKLHATKEAPGPNDWKLVESRESGLRRVLSPEHHAYLDFLANGGVATKVPFTPVHVEPVVLDRDEAIPRALQELHGVYDLAIMRWEAFGDTTKAEALSVWKKAVADRVSELMGG